MGKGIQIICLVVRMDVRHSRPVVVASRGWILQVCGEENHELGIRDEGLSMAPVYVGRVSNVAMPGMLFVSCDIFVPDRSRFCTAGAQFVDLLISWAGL